MALAIVGSGFGRTSTLSLKLALEQLGFGRCYHMLEVAQNAGHAARWREAGRGERVDWDALFAGYRSAVDWPSARFWRELAEHYPEAKIVHTERPAAAWYKSARDTIYQAMVRELPAGIPGAAREQLDMARELILRGVFGGRFEDEAHAISVYEAHNARVRREIPRERLLVYEPGQGWGPLCEFLGVSAPAAAYPRVNTTEDFLARFRA